MSYIKSRLRTAAAFAVMAGISAAVAALSGVSAFVILYSCAICAAVLAAFTVADYLRFRKKRTALEHLKAEIAESLDNLPAPDNDIERGYAELCALVFEKLTELRAQDERRMSGMSDYYTMWAHQIKTPIAAMRLLLDGRDTPQSRELSEELLRIEQYTQMVLCYIRLESPQSDLVIRPCSLDGMIKRAVRRFSSQFIRKRLTLAYEPVDVQVLTDEKWFVFVLEQLLSNAVKYTREGGVTITADDHALCIADTGIGIAPEDLPRIFDKGYTGCNGRADMRASGIGLYLCRRICASLGMTISIDSGCDGTAVKLGLDRPEVDFRD